MNQIRCWDLIAAVVWFTGMGAMALYALYSIFSIRLRVRMAGGTGNPSPTTEITGTS